MYSARGRHELGAGGGGAVPAAGGTGDEDPWKTSNPAREAGG